MCEMGNRPLKLLCLAFLMRSIWYYSRKQSFPFFFLFFFSFLSSSNFVFFLFFERHTLWKSSSLDLLLEHLTYKLKGSLTRATSLKASINTKVLWCKDSVKDCSWGKNDSFFFSSHLIQIRILHNWIIFPKKKWVYSKNSFSIISISWAKVFRWRRTKKYQMTSTRAPEK